MHPRLTIDWETGSSASMQHAPADRQRAEQRLVQSLSPQVRLVRLSHVSPAHPGLGRWECFLQCYSIRQLQLSEYTFRLRKPYYWPKHVKHWYDRWRCTHFN